MKNPESLNFSKPYESDTETNTQPEDFSENTEQARKIAEQGNYSIIKNELVAQNLLESEIERVTSKYSEFLSEIEFLTKQDLEIFTIIELYDTDLAMHSIETYRIAKEKVEKNLAFDVVLIDLFAKENVTPEQFFRACLLHDVGKIEIPNFIMNNKINHKEMDVYLRGLVLKEKDKETLDKLRTNTGEDINIEDESDLNQILKKYRLRAVHFVPVKFLLNDEEKSVLEARGFDLNSSLIDIIKMHEAHSETILEKEGLVVESALAGSHHNYHGNGSPYPITIDALQLSVDMVELIRIADMTEALTTSRSYKKKRFSKPKVLKIILDEARVGRINTEMAYLWIEDEIRNIDESDEDLTMEDLEDIAFLKGELAIIESNMSENPFSLQVA